MLVNTSVNLVLILLFIFSCNDATETKIYWKYESPQINEYFKMRLGDKNIEYRTDEEDKVWFNTSSYSQVDKIKKEIQLRYLKNSISFMNEAKVDELCIKIKEDGHECITWYSAKGYKMASWLDEGQASADKNLHMIRSQSGDSVE